MDRGIARIGAIGRIGLSFGCVLLSVAITALMSLPAVPHGRRIRMLFAIVPVTFLFAFPVWLLSLPLVIALKNAEGWRLWMILVAGVLAGPGFILIWSIISIPSGGHITWQGSGSFFITALKVSLIATVAYAFALRAIHRRSIAREID
jgi:hypothetical protein